MITKIKDIIKEKLPGSLWASIVAAITYLLLIVWKEISLPLVQKLLPELSKTGLLALNLSQFLVITIALIYILAHSDKRRHYRFYKRLGINFHKKTGEPFCPSCLLSNIESPLKENEKMWICQRKGCGQFYRNPDYAPPPEKPRKASHWMLQ
jgi:hypothetical protein